MELSDEQEELLKQRQKGILPEIELPGQVYVVEWTERVLRPKDRLDLKPLRLSEKGKGFYADSYHFLYDTEKKELVEIDEFDLQPKVVVVKIPGGLLLDPVGVARESRLDERRFVANNPISPKIVAEVLQVSKNEISRFFERQRNKRSFVEKLKKWKRGRNM